MEKPADLPKKYSEQILLKRNDGTLNVALPTDAKTGQSSIVGSHVSIEANDANELVDNWLKHKRLFNIFFGI